MTATLDVLVLPAYENLDGLPGEAAPWHEAYDLDRVVEVAGAPAPLYHDGCLGVVPTGVGKSAAATTVSALLSAPEVDLREALVCSVGVAGGPPAVPVGSVVLADTVLDWDDKCRFGGDSLALNPYTDEQGVFDLDPDLVEWGRSVAAGVELREPAESVEHGQASEGPAEILGGVNVCGDEHWHGEAIAEQVAWLLAERDAGEYRVTEMEDAGTAFALERFGLLDRYLTVRGVSNHDRPPGDGDPAESMFDPAFESGFGVAVENAVSVGQAIVDAHVSTDSRVD
jgi:purine nucleoside permease